MVGAVVVIALEAAPSALKAGVATITTPITVEVGSGTTPVVHRSLLHFEIT